MIHAELGEDGAIRSKSKKSKGKKSKTTRAKGKKKDELDSDDSLNDFIDDNEIEGKKKPKTISRR